MTQQLTEVARSRFKLLDKPFAHPGKCAVCGAVNRSVVDFDLDLDEYGRVYFCVTCLTQVAHDNLDMVDAHELRAAQLTVEELNHKLSISAEATNDYIEGIRSLHSDYIRSIHSLPDLSDDQINGGSEEVYGQSAGGEQGEIRDSSLAEQTPDGSISSEGSISLPANSSDGKPSGPFDFSN